MGGRWKKWIESQPKGMFYRSRYYSLKYGAVDFETRISITFNEIGFEFATDIEI